LQASFRRLSGRTGPGAGRPAKVYERAASEVAVSLPARRYQDAAAVFAEGLEQLASELGDDQVTGAVQAAAERHGRAAGSQVLGAIRGRKGARRRREQLVSFLDSAGYEPAVDPTDGSVTLGNCPYRALSASHRDLTCGMNVAWARGLVAAAGVTDIEPHLAPEPGRCCVVFAPSE
jgi:predicted ArsR family transcriptional regulator